MNTPTAGHKPALLSPAQRDGLAVVAAEELPALLASVLASLPHDALPLRDCASRGGMIDPADCAISTLQVNRTATTMTARVSVFFTEVVGGCNCHDDPARYNDHEIFRAEIDLNDGQVKWLQAEA